MGEMLLTVEKVCLLVFLAIESRMDIKEQKISIRTAGAAAFAGIVCILAGMGMEEYAWLKAGAGMIPGLMMLLAARATREAVGYGDGIIVLVCGLYLGIAKSIGLLLTALTAAAMFSLILIVFRRAGSKDRIPFVPFLLCALLVVFWE